MSDQSEKIIHLAREILSSERSALHAETATTKEQTDPQMISIRAACLAAVAAVFGGASFTHMIDEMRRPVTRFEQVEINALVFYAAREKATSEEAVRNDIQETLQLKSLENISAHEYKRVRNYLWERLQG